MGTASGEPGLHMRGLGHVVLIAALISCSGAHAASNDTTDGAAQDLGG